MVRYFLIFFFTCTLLSCANMFNGSVMPNQCKKCEVQNKTTGEILRIFEGCGSENTRLEEQAKEAAYDLSRNGSLCNLDVVWESWKKEPEEANEKPINRRLNK